MPPKRKLQALAEFTRDEAWQVLRGLDEDEAASIPPETWTRILDLLDAAIGDSILLGIALARTDQAWADEAWREVQVGLSFLGETGPDDNDEEEHRASLRASAAAGSRYMVMQRIARLKSFEPPS